MQPYCLLLWSGALIATVFCIAGQVAAFQSADGSINRRYMCRGTATMEFPQLHHTYSQYRVHWFTVPTLKCRVIKWQVFLFKYNILTFCAERENGNSVAGIFSCQSIELLYCMFEFNQFCVQVLFTALFYVP